MLKSAEEQLNNLNQARHRPHILDDETITHIINVYTEQQQMIPIHKEQCMRWREKELNERQLSRVKKIKKTVELLDATISDILKLAREDVIWRRK